MHSKIQFKQQENNISKNKQENNISEMTHEFKSMASKQFLLTSSADPEPMKIMTLVIGLKPSKPSLLEL
jgi:hypothetical protein